MIGEHLRKELRGQRKATGRIPPELIVQYLASTFIRVLNWWVESRSSLPASEMDDLFRALVVPTLTATLV